MSLARRMEILLDADVDLHGSAGEPHSAALGQQRRLGYLLHAQDFAVKAPRFLLATLRRSKLHMVDRGKWHWNSRFSCYPAFNEEGRFACRIKLALS